MPGMATRALIFAGEILSNEQMRDLFQEHPGATRHSLHGEIFISIDDAVKQAREFQTSWQSELVRYIIHGLLHLQGHDDLQPAARGKMKREENRFLKKLTEVFPLKKLRRSSAQ
ncbi:MAG: rRNA maturation RNase YbeY, partial [Verrucomicrobiota bacterium]